MLIQDGKVPQRTYHIEWDAGVHYEFLISITAYCEKEDWETFRSVATERPTLFFDEINLPDDLNSDMTKIHERIGWGAILAAALDLGPRTVSSVQEWIQWFEKISPIVWYAGILKYFVPAHIVDLELLELVISGDKAAKEQMLKLLVEHTKYEPIRALVEMDETEWANLKQLTLDVCKKWYELYFTGIESQMKQFVEKGLEHVQRQTRDVSSEQCVFAATKGIEYFPEPGIWSVRLVPQYHFRPFNFYLEYRDAKVFFFPIPDEVVSQTDGAAMQEVAQAMRCLGDENRLKILQFLKDGDKTFGEIVQFLSISKSTVHHHMVTLRSQGFVTIRNIDEDQKYRLRKERWRYLVQLVEDKLGF
jgi:DNA-binding transcriptional ArsR family regulator